VRAGKIVDVHGDLRPEHVCLRPDVHIIDCLEFSPELRLADSADELAFLALECERLGAGATGTLLPRAYGDASGEPPQPSLAHSYQSYRACLRAAIALRQLQEPKFRYSPQWLARANEYLLLAERHALSCA
jgi:aminoglycoside phosphotransferase family enzyme